ncbi:MAG: hypothetical protein AAFQ07_18825, partial [Chloroflexota bacterium]
MGENLYADRYAFVRELLQNAIDTTRHRQFSEGGRDVYKAQAIDFTTWHDENGYQWVRIDDYGMGMDATIISDYFLRVGRSYYQSNEFRVEQLDYDKTQGQKFTPISRFGIGVLSCFI